MARNNTDQGQRYRADDNQRNQKCLELNHHQYVDQQYRGHECCAHITEGNIGYAPFAIPGHHGLRIIRRRSNGPACFEFDAVGGNVIFKQARPFDQTPEQFRPAHFLLSVDGSSQTASDFAGHPLQVA